MSVVNWQLKGLAHDIASLAGLGPAVAAIPNYHARLLSLRGNPAAAPLRLRGRAAAFVSGVLTTSRQRFGNFMLTN